MVTLDLIIPGPPVPKARARVTRRGTYTPARVRQYEQGVALIAQAACSRHACQWPTSEPVQVTVRAFLPDARRRDLDNVVKAITDALNGVAYVDDAQIVAVIASKGIDRDEPRAEIRVEVLA